MRARRGAVTTAACLMATVLVSTVGAAVAGDPESTTGAWGARDGVTSSTGQSLIQGIVVDQFGTPVDDVQVSAINGLGEVEATSLTYASDRASGPQHGYFYLYVPAGRYDLSFAKSGHVTSGLQGAQAQETRSTSLGQVTVPKAQVDTRAILVVRDRTLVEGEKVVLDAGATTSRALGQKSVRGTIRVSRLEGPGKKALFTSILNGRGATRKFVFRDLKAGRHVLQVSFSGDEYVSSKSKPVTVIVQETKRRSRR